MRGYVYEEVKFQVILADDDPDDRLLFSEAFRDIKPEIEVKLAKDGSELIKYLEKNIKLPNVIFLDLNMPRMNGIECLQYIKKNNEWKDICIAIYSTSSSQDDIENTFVLGANVYIRKPNNYNTLKEILNKVISFNSHYGAQQLDRQSFMMCLGTELSM